MAWTSSCSVFCSLEKPAAGCRVFGPRSRTNGTSVLLDGGTPGGNTQIFISSLKNRTAMNGKHMRYHEISLEKGPQAVNPYPNCNFEMLISDICISTFIQQLLHQIKTTSLICHHQRSNPRITEVCKSVASGEKKIHVISALHTKCLIVFQAPGEDETPLLLPQAIPSAEIRSGQVTIKEQSSHVSRRELIPVVCFLCWFQTIYK